MKDAVAVVPELFYDIIGVFLPGAALLTGLALLGYPLKMTVPSSVYQALVLILVAYIVGHVLYSFSTIAVAKIVDFLGYTPKQNWLDPEARASVSRSFRKKLVKRIAEKWGLEAGPEIDKKAAYELCRSYVHVRDKERAAFVRKEQAYGEFARSMVLVAAFFCFAPWLGLCGIKGHEEKMTISVMAAVGVACFVAKYIQCRSVDAIFIYINFLVLDKESVDDLNAKDEETANPSLKRTAGAAA